MEGINCDGPFLDHRYYVWDYWIGDAQDEVKQYAPSRTSTRNLQLNYNAKNILVLGLGRSGLSATRLLQQAGAIVTVVDSGSSEALEQRAEILRAEGVAVFLAEEALRSVAFSLQSSCDLAILSPGIDPASPLVQQVVTQGVRLIGELELAYDFCQCPIVAITGTNGKTTTTELTVAGLQGAGLKTIACGNIGLPFSEAVLKSSELDVIVIEVSSFQLETVDRFHAHVAVWLNLSPNHLDRYKSIREYREAKLRIFRNQQPNDIAVIPKQRQQTQQSQVLHTFEPNSKYHELAPKYVISGTDPVVEELPQLIAKEMTFSSQDAKADFFFDGKSVCFHGVPLLALNETKLHGTHNAENIMAALAVGVALNLAPQKMLKAISEYRAASHRCEIVLENQGVLWINDSKSTTLDATEKAIEAVEKDRRIILIAGGKNKGSSFASILPLVKERVKEAILIGEMKGVIAGEWQDVISHQVDSMEEAVQHAAAHAERGDVVLLSPGTSSYDMFKNYEERGNQFKSAVKQLFVKKPTNT